MSAERDSDKTHQVWDSLALDERHRVIYEVAKKHGAALAGIYPDVVSVGYGARSTYSRIDGDRSLHHDEPCICFLVKKKRPPKPGLEMIPRFLYFQVETGSGEKTCAIPIDVEDGTLQKPRLESGGGRENIQAKWRKRRVTGTITCFVQAPERGERVYALGCHHVFHQSKFRRLNGSGEAWKRVRLLFKDRQWGKPSKYRGGIAKTGISHDAALGIVLDRDLANRTVVHPKLIENAHWEIPIYGSRELIIVTPHGLVKTRANKVFSNYKMMPFFSKSRPVFPIQEVIVEMKIHQGFTRGGDSGSPVVIEVENEWFLAGMHVGSSTINGAQWTYMIPAHTLLRASSFGLAFDGTLMVRRHA